MCPSQVFLPQMGDCPSKKLKVILLRRVMSERIPIYDYGISASQSFKYVFDASDSEGNFRSSVKDHWVCIQTL